jgi:hypothetical protein
VFLDNRAQRVSGVLEVLEELILLNIVITKDGLVMIVCLITVISDELRLTDSNYIRWIWWRCLLEESTDGSG